jgi:hypothetical protein
MVRDVLTFVPHDRPIWDRTVPDGALDLSDRPRWLRKEGGSGKTLLYCLSYWL